MMRLSGCSYARDVAGTSSVSTGERRECDEMSEDKGRNGNRM